MKKYQKYILFSFLTFIFITSCDRVDHPVIPIIGYNNLAYGDAPSFENATEEMQIQRVVIEDFTGHQCGNCPEAAIVAEDIKAAHPEKISIIAIHAGDFTDVSSSYPTDWTSSVGDFLWSTIPAGGQFNPGGRVNRAPESDVLKLYTAWNSLTEDQFALTPKAIIQIQHSLHEEDGVLNVHVFTEMLEAYEGNLKMVAYLTESELVGDQLDYSSDPEHIEEYDFEYVLRAGINGDVGVSLGENFLAGSTIQKDYTYEYNTSWNMLHSHVVAVVYDGDDGTIINSFEIDIE